MRAILAVIVLASSLICGCAWMQQPCKCGESFESDPWTDDEFAVTPSHALSAHCLCRCGDGPVVLEDPSARCDFYEGYCTTGTGQEADYVCD